MTLQKEREKAKTLKGEGPGLSPRGRTQTSKSGKASLGQSFKSRPWVEQVKTKGELEDFLLTSSLFTTVLSKLEISSHSSPQHYEVEIIIPQFLEIKSDKAKPQAQFTSYLYHCCSLNTSIFRGPLVSYCRIMDGYFPSLGVHCVLWIVCDEVDLYKIHIKVARQNQKFNL